MSESDRLLDANALAERWGVKPAHVYRLTREGQLPVIRLGPRYVRYSLAAIAEFERNGGTGGQAA
jgi:predicted DNA-binding transcriptional regulator AlpA